MGMLTALANLGCEVTIFGSTLISNTRWYTPEAREFFDRLGIKVELHRFSPIDFEIGRMAKRLYRRVLPQQVVTPRLPIPPGMRQRFIALLRLVQPDAVWMNYACWDELLPDDLEEIPFLVVDTLDLITANMQMQRILEREIKMARRTTASCSGSRMLDENFFDEYNISACKHEFEIYDRYNCTIAISAKEGEIITQNTQKTLVRTIPMGRETSPSRNDYDDLPLLVLGYHIFNLQGGLYFAHRVLPIIIKQAPSFRCRMTGRLCHDRLLPRTPALILEGFVPDLTRHYQHARFALCPIFGGTGQQAKIVEAMAHGLAVVAMRAAADSSPLRHGQNGFIASDAAEFAEYTLYLWDHPVACLEMGKRAKETIANEFSHVHLVEDVRRVLELAPRSPW